MTGWTPSQQVAGDVNSVITRVVATLQDCGPEMVGRYTLGNVAAYLLQWALHDLPTEQQDQAMDNFCEYVAELLDEPSRRRLDG